jgi:hypothetical protein
VVFNNSGRTNMVQISGDYTTWGFLKFNYLRKLF